MLGYMGAFKYLWIDLIINIILIILLLFFIKKIEKIKFKYLVILFLLTRLIYYIFKVSSGSVPFDSDTAWYYNYGRLFLGGEYPVMEYPQGALFIFTAISRFAPSIESFRLIFPLFQLPFGLIVIYSINWFGKALRNKKISNGGIAVYALSPSILWFWFYRFDEMAVALLLLSLIFLSANKKEIGSFFAFIGFSVKWFPIVIMPNYWLYCIKKRHYKELTASITIFALLSCLLFLPFYITDREKFIHTYETHLPRNILGESSYFSMESAITGEKIAPYESPDPPKIFTNNVALLMTVIAFLSWFLYVWKTIKKERLVIYSCFTVLLFVVTNRIYSTQYIVWLLPLLIIIAMHLKLKENEIKSYMVLLVLMQLFNFLKSPVPFENWIIFARSFWIIFISIIIFLFVKSRNTEKIRIYNKSTS